MAESSLVGTWSLLAWYNEEADGTRHYPLGQDATGYISYTTDGFVFVQMSAADRQAYAIADPFGGTPEEDSRAIKSQITYSGRYNVKAARVIHHVTQSSCPNWVGTEQVRDVSFTDQGLLLSAEGALFQGRHVTAYVEWERAI